MRRSMLLAILAIPLSLPSILTAKERSISVYIALADNEHQGIFSNLTEVTTSAPSGEAAQPAISRSHKAPPLVPPSPQAPAPNPQAPRVRGRG